MLKKLLILFLALLTQFTFASGDEVLNGSGFAESQIIKFYGRLLPGLEICLTDPFVCQLNEMERQSLDQIFANPLWKKSADQVLRFPVGGDLIENCECLQFSQQELYFPSNGGFEPYGDTILVQRMLEKVFALTKNVDLSLYPDLSRLLVPALLVKKKFQQSYNSSYPTAMVTSVNSYLDIRQTIDFIFSDSTINKTIHLQTFGELLKKIPEIKNCPFQKINSRVLQNFWSTIRWDKVLYNANLVFWCSPKKEYQFIKLNAEFETTRFGSVRSYGLTVEKLDPAVLP